MTAPTTLAVATCLGHYEIAGLLGSPGMGRVYRARGGAIMRETPRPVSDLDSAIPKDLGAIRRVLSKGPAPGLRGSRGVIDGKDIVVGIFLVLAFARSH